MLYPSIQELLNVTAKDGQERLNKYSITMATAKCARLITNEYLEERYNAEKKKDDKEAAAAVKKEYRDEKAVKNALREMKNGEFEVFLPNEEGYESSHVVIENYVEPDRFDTPRYVKPDTTKADVRDEEDDENDIIDEEEESTEELMGADGVFTNDSGFTIEDAED
jgi:DNA-directed RNA polymerase subunit K/omega